MVNLHQKNRSQLTVNKNRPLAARPKSISRRLADNKEFYVLLLPAIILVAVFSYLPIYGIQIAFKDFKIMKGIWGSEWVGFLQFQRLIESASFLQVLRNTLVISFYRLLFGFPAPIIFALLFNEIKSTRFKKPIQTISYLPHFLSWVVISGVVIQILSPDRGFVNYLIKICGGETVNFIGEASWFRTILIITGIWQSVGWSSVIYLATIAGIDQELYDAAKVDGANRFDAMLHITLPSLFPVITILFILQIGGILNAGFDQIFNLYSPLTYSVGDIIDTFVYRRGLGESMDYSFTTAVGLFKNIIGFILIIFTNTVTKRLSDSGVW